MTATSLNVENAPVPPRTPDDVGSVVRDGVRVVYRVYENPGRPTVLLMPTWSIVPSRFWKSQVPYLARHFRTITFDGRGSGSSDRPAGAPAYQDSEFVADTLAVLDATDTERAVLVAASAGATWAVLTAARHPDRVSGILAIAPASAIGVPFPRRDKPFDERIADTEGWAKFNRFYWTEGGYDDFLDFFFHEMFPEPHSTKQIEDGIGWGREILPATLVDTQCGRMGLDGALTESVVDACRDLRCPVLVIHGTDDRIRPPGNGARLAELTGGSLVTVVGGGHATQVRDPVLVNLLVKDFAGRVAEGEPPSMRRWTRPANSPRRALYLSSPIGLGHARRDLAIARELRKHHPDLEIDWLAQHPVTAVLDGAGERVHPGSAWLASESHHVEHEAGEHDLHAFQAIRRMDETLVANFMVFHDVAESGDYDLVIGDEAWDLDYFLHENPSLKRFSFAWMTDFVGWLPMPDGGDAEAALTADYNAEMIEQRARLRRVRDRSVFVGDPDDIVNDTFGPGLPSIREWTEQNFDFAGYVTGFTPPDEAARSAARSRLGIRGDQRLCVVTVGGSGVGVSLLRRVLDAVPLARRREPDLEFLVVAGPRIDPVSLPRCDGVRVVGYLPDLPSTLAAADLAVVQGGLTTCMELTACRTPFVYVPLRHHFEQQFHVRHRLDRYRAGRHLAYEQASDPDLLADVLVAELGRPMVALPVDPSGAARAAGMIAELLGG